MIGPETSEQCWTRRTRALLEDAISELDRGHGDEVLFQISAAQAAMRILMGELPAADLADYPFPGEEAVWQARWDAEHCICSPEQRAAGGFKGGCPAHSLRR